MNLPEAGDAPIQSAGIMRRPRNRGSAGLLVARRACSARLEPLDVACPNDNFVLLEILLQPDAQVRPPSLGD